MKVTALPCVMVTALGEKTSPAVAETRAPWALTRAVPAKAPRNNDMSNIFFSGMSGVPIWDGYWSR
jgi:hypothetical protein